MVVVSCKFVCELIALSCLALRQTTLLPKSQPVATESSCLRSVRSIGFPSPPSWYQSAQFWRFQPPVRISDLSL